MKAVILDELVRQQHAQIGRMKDPGLAIGFEPRTV